MRQTASPVQAAPLIVKYYFDDPPSSPLIKLCMVVIKIECSVCRLENYVG